MIIEKHFLIESQRGAKKTHSAKKDTYTFTFGVPECSTNIAVCRCVRVSVPLVIVNINSRWIYNTPRVCVRVQCCSRRCCCYCFYRYLYLSLLQMPVISDCCCAHRHTQCIHTRYDKHLLLFSIYNMPFDDALLCTFVLCCLVLPFFVIVGGAAAAAAATVVIRCVLLVCP